MTIGSLFRATGQVMNGLDYATGGIAYMTKLVADGVLGRGAAINTLAHGAGFLGCLATSLPVAAFSVPYHALFDERPGLVWHRVKQDITSPTRNLLINGALAAGLYYSGYGGILAGTLGLGSALLVPGALVALVGLNFVAHQLYSGLYQSAQKFSNLHVLHLWR